MPTSRPSADPRTIAATPAQPLAPVFVGDRLWLDFVNTDDVRRGARVDALYDFDAFVRWLELAAVLDAERAAGLRRRGELQRAGAAAALAEARRVRAVLRELAERGAAADGVRRDALAEINRVLSRSAGTRRVESHPDGTFARSFVPVGDAFAGLMIPVVDSAAEALILGELPRVRRCAGEGCARVFYDATKNARRRWCDMATCGNRAKAARFRARGERRDAPGEQPPRDVERLARGEAAARAAWAARHPASAG
jgi:predicted RNA-binding Zn ribbon-like protein